MPINNIRLMYMCVCDGRSAIYVVDCVNVCALACVSV